MFQPMFEKFLLFFRPVVEVRALSMEELYLWVHALPPSMEVAVLLGGDRLTCIDYAFGVRVNGTIATVATIASQGEQMSGEPTLVALFTPRRFRGKGYDVLALKAAIAYCKACEWPQMRFDILSTAESTAVAALTDEERSLLQLHDSGVRMEQWFN